MSDDLDGGVDPYDEFAKLIGKVSIEYNQAHSFVFKIFWQLSRLHVDHAKAIFFSIKSDTGQRDLTIAFINSLISDDASKKKNIIQSIQNLSKLSSVRNAAIHTIWSYYWDDDDNVVMSFDNFSVPHKSLEDGKEIIQFKKMLNDLDNARNLLMISFMECIHLRHVDENSRHE